MHSLAAIDGRSAVPFLFLDLLLFPAFLALQLCLSLFLSFLPPLTKTGGKTTNSCRQQQKTQNTALHRPLGLLLVSPLCGDRRRPFQDAPALRGHEGGLGPPRHPLGRRGVRARLGPFADPVPGGKLDVF